MKKIILLITLLIVPFALTGCSLGELFLSSGSSNQGGVFKSVDFGETFQNSSLIGYKGDKPITVSNLQVTKIEIDYLNSKNVFLGAVSDGVWYSNNYGENWRQIFKTGYIYDIVLDPQNSGVVYISNGKNVYKSLDLGENWDSLYWETRDKYVISALAINPAENLTLYLGTSGGEIQKTVDGGESWEKIFELKGAVIKKILINPKKTSTIYVGTASAGIFKSDDAGKNWTNLKENYFPSTRENLELRRARKGVTYFQDLIFDLTKNDGLLYGSNFGLIRSDDGGQTWSDINILTPANEVYARELAINPRDNKQIYYGTLDAFYRTFDSGKTWLVSPLPTNYSVGALAIDTINPNIIYMGMRKIK
ncbi:hypothetical protein L6278_00960 [Candidatus Parcubacteria bacterium]|nr:hypothetical protein [Patescibacteria group bacterium]MBU4481974.1 hypothetical protein [Patescibacteria group bacterium]MCG2686689.1 hypothetical protein [Candidatus Parcubacteria bacterium]